MAYALRYYKEIPQTDGSAVRLEIYKKDSTASAVEIGAVVQVLSLEIQGQQGDIDTPIQKTSLHMTFVDASDIENGQKNGFWEEFYTPDALLWKVILKAKDAEETAFRTIWGGYVTPDSFSEDLVYRGSVSITARDNIGHMQDFPFDALGDADGMISLRNLVEGGWDKIASPMQLILNPQFTLYCDGVPAYDTLMNVSAFEGMDWYKAIESALASYGMVMRYTGDNIVHVGALRFMPHFGWVDVESMPHVEPTFITGATRELVPAVKRIEENVDYKVGPLVCEPVQPSDYTGDVESFLIEGNSVDYDGIAWTIKNRTSGSGWCNPELSLFFNPQSYEFGDERNTDKDVMWLSANSYDISSYFARYAEYSRYINSATKISFDARFGSPYYFAINGKMYAGNDIIKSCLIVIKVINEGSTYYLQSDGEWGDSPEKLNIEVIGSSLSMPIVLSSFPGTSLVCVQFHQILTEAAARSSARYIPLYSARISQQTPIREKNTVNTLYNADNNVILSRDPELGPAFDRVALPDFIKNGIFYREGNEVLPARLWAWSGGSNQQMAVWNHLQLLCYYAKPNNFISGTIVKTDVSRMGNIWMWHGAEHILVSGRYNFLNGRIESAVLREFARYEDMWTEVSGAGLPDTEQESKTNVEGSSTGSSSAPSYTSTQTVNIGSTGGGGGGASYLNDLIDVNVEGVGAQSLLYFNGAEWVAQNKAMFLKGVTDRLSILERFWYDEEGCLCTDMDVKVKGNIVATGEVSAGGSAEEEEQQGDVYRMFHYKQETPSKEWKIAHYLGKFPNVKVVDSLKQLCYGDVFFDDANNIRIVFGAAESGDAYLD